LTESFRFDDVEVRPTERIVLVRGQPAALGARAFDVLVALIEGHESVITKDALLDRAWQGLVVEENNLQVQISALRKLFGATTIATVAGRGYRFTRPVHTAPVGSAIATAWRPVTNVPRVSGPLVGREVDLRTMQSCLVRSRLVCVTGAGGIGKTRLAQTVANEAAGRYADGVCWVDLAALSSGDKVVPGVAKAAGIPLGHGGQDELVRALAERELLLVLDNCEHLVAAVADVAVALIAQTQKVSVLATSQQPLQLKGEVVIRLEPLALPPLGLSLNAAREHGAVQLFERSASAADGRFALTEQNVALAIDLCRRLDGMPLAIEMAAARAPFFGLARLREQIDQRFAILHTQERDAPPRQKSLRLTLDWSHSLLDDNEKKLLRRLSVFVGSIGVEAAQHCAADIMADASIALVTLEGLVSRSLLTLEQLEPPRYRLLETTRAYAGEQLVAAGELDVALRAHGEAMAQVAEAALRDRINAPSVAWLAKYRADYDDLAEAFDRAHARLDADVAAALVVVLREMDQLRALFTSSGRRVHNVINLLPHASALGKARLYGFIASCGWVTVAEAPRLACAEQAVTLWRSLGDRLRLSKALCLLATEAASSQRSDRARAAIAEAEAIEDPEWPPYHRLQRMLHKGWVAYFLDEPLACRDVMRQLLQQASRAGEREIAAHGRVWLTEVALSIGDMDEEAAELARTAVDECRRLRQFEYLDFALATWCSALLILRDAVTSRPAIAELFRLERKAESCPPHVLMAVATLAALSGNVEDALGLLGHTNGVEAENNVRRRIDKRVQEAANEAIADSFVAPERAEQMLAAGRKLSQRDATEVAAGLVLRLCPTSA